MNNIIALMKKVLKLLSSHKCQSHQATKGTFSVKEKELEKEISALRNDPSICARFAPYLKNYSWWIIPKIKKYHHLSNPPALPIPPPKLWAGYGHTDDEYVLTGERHYKQMMQVVTDTNFSLTPESRIFDFGCAAGRMIRHFYNEADKCEIWGADISADHILWCQQHLSPPFKFVTTTTFPHLPFEDNFFNLIYSCSVFTHISDLADTWLLELRRILRPDGRLYITVHDNRTIDILLSAPKDNWLHDTAIRHQLISFDKKTHFTECNFSMFIVGRDTGNAQVFHDIDFLRESWGQYLKILSITPEAYEYQTALVLKK